MKMAMIVKEGFLKSNGYSINLTYLNREYLERLGNNNWKFEQFNPSQL